MYRHSTDDAAKWMVIVYLGMSREYAAFGVQALYVNNKLYWNCRS